VALGICSAFLASKYPSIGLPILIKKYNTWSRKRLAMLSRTVTVYSSYRMTYDKQTATDDSET